MSQHSNDAVNPLESNTTHHEPSFGTASASATQPKLSTLIKQHDMSDMRNMSWLVDGLIPLGELTMLGGNAGVGKSQILASLMAAVTTGRPWPIDDRPCAQGSVIHINVEDSPEEISTPRLVAAGADVTKVHELYGVPEGDHYRPFSISDDLEHLREALCAFPNTKLVVIDPLGAHLGNKVSNQDNRVRMIVDPLTKLAKSFDIAVVLVTHLTKASSQSYLHRLPGSVGFGAAIRAAFAVDKDPTGEWDNLLFGIKNNYAPGKPCFAFHIESAEVQAARDVIRTSRVVFEPESVPMPEELERGGSKKAEGAKVIEQAKQFLKGLLENGPVERELVEKRAVQEGFAPRTVQRAKKELGIAWRKHPERGCRVYVLPDPETGEYSLATKPAETKDKPKTVWGQYRPAPDSKGSVGPHRMN